MVDFDIPIYKLAATEMPHSGKSEELLNYEGISASGILKKVKETLKG